MHLNFSNDLMRMRLAFHHRKNNRLHDLSQEYIDFSSNDYLCIASHVSVKKALKRGINQYGFGSGASSLVSGYYHIQKDFEEKMAEWLNREKAILFNSGYHANLGILTTLLSHRSHVLGDKYCHASLLDGVRLTNAKLKRYRHHDLTHLIQLLNHTNYNLLMTESVFSMEGDITPINEIVSLTQQHQIPMLIDDAHGIGVLGEKGLGVIEHHGLDQETVPYLISPLGKAFGGIGAIVSGKSDFIEALIQRARTYRYTTALPSGIIQGLSASLNVMMEENWRREKLKSNIHFFVKEAIARGLPIVSNDLTPIKCLLVQENDKAIKMQTQLMHRGLFIACIRSPTVPHGTARLRISLNCDHSEQEILFLLDNMKAYLDEK